MAAMSAKLLGLVSWKDWWPTLLCVLILASFLVFHKRVNWTVAGGLIAAFGAVVSIFGTKIDQKELTDTQLELGKKQAEIAVLTEKNFAWVTGGNEWINLQLDAWTDTPGTVSFGISKAGDFPAYDLSFEFIDVDSRTKFVTSYQRTHDKQFSSMAATAAASSLRFSLPIVYPLSFFPKVATFPFTPSTQPHLFEIHAFARNGKAGYLCKLAVINGQLVRAWKIDKEIGGEKQSETEDVAPNFPRNSSGGVDW
jgi:hypothetical protein